MDLLGNNLKIIIKQIEIFKPIDDKNDEQKCRHNCKQSLKRLFQ